MKNLIIFHGKGKSNRNGGPSPDLYKINPDSRYYIGIDISVSGIQGLILDLDSNIVAKYSSKPNYSSQQNLTTALNTLVNGLLHKSKLDIQVIKGIGIGISALVDANNGNIKGSAGISILNGYNIKEMMEKTFSTVTFVDNDINLLALGQKLFVDEETKAKNVLCLGIRSGTGLGIIIEGKLYRGSEGMSGNVECFDNAISEDTIVDQIKSYVKTHGFYEVKELEVTKHTEVTFDKVYAALEHKNPIVVGIVRDACYNLGVLAGKLVQIFNPDYFLVSSRIFNNNEELFDYMVSVARNFCKDLHYENVIYRKLPVDESTVAFSAANQMIENFFDVHNVFYK